MLNHSYVNLANIIIQYLYNKLPSSVGTIMEKVIQEHLEVIVGLDDTLGTRITTLRKWISEKCMEKTAKREAKINVCCDRIQNKVGKRKKFLGK